MKDVVYTEFFPSYPARSDLGAAILYKVEDGEKIIIYSSSLTEKDAGSIHDQQGHIGMVFISKHAEVSKQLWYQKGVFIGDTHYQSLHIKCVSPRDILKLYGYQIVDSEVKPTNPLQRFINILDE